MPEDARIRRGVLVASALAIVGIAALMWRLYPREVEVPAGPAPRLAHVLAADAGVERRSAEEWSLARAGDALHVTDSLRTGEGSTAEIALGPGTHVTLAERSEVTVRELTAAVQRVGIVRGRIGVDLQPDGTRVLRVEDPSGKVAAFGTSGRFGVLAKGDALAVASTGGQVTVESGGGTVKLPAGAETFARSGSAPLPPRTIPRDVVLRVARRIEEQRASLCLALELDPASELSVNGVPVEVPADGKVLVRLPPNERRRGIEVTVRDASGAVERKRLPCWQYEGDVSELEVRWNAR